MGLYENQIIALKKCGVWQHRALCLCLSLPQFIYKIYVFTRYSVINQLLKVVSG